MYSELSNNPDKFVKHDKPISSLDEFESASVVAANQGLRLSKMDKHTYEVYEKKSSG